VTALRQPDSRYEKPTSRQHWRFTVSQYRDMTRFPGYKFAIPR
jgi:hypothetical protein